MLARRQFLKSMALASAGIMGNLHPLPARMRRVLKITDIEAHEIVLPYRDYNAKALFRYHGLTLQRRTVYIVHTDKGLEGYGERGGPASEVDYSAYIGTDPFDWIGDSSNLAMNMAVYDLMGKYLEVPAWKLLGQQVRSWIPVAA